MKHLSTTIAILFLLSLNQNRLHGQCSFDPTITGDTVICAGQESILSTQSFDAYQWYYRYIGTNDPMQPIVGATSQTLEITQDLYLAYVSVDATLNGCTERSPQVLIDLYSFLPATVMSTGQFYIDSDGQMNLCPGDTIWQILQLPYTININWFNNDVLIPGAHDDTLVVTAPGSFFAEGSPELCPDYVNRMEGYITVIAGSGPNCVSAVADPSTPRALAATAVYWQDSKEISLQSDEPGVVQAALWNMEGRLVGETKFTRQGRIATGEIPSGLYLIRLQAGNHQAILKVAITGP